MSPLRRNKPLGAERIVAANTLCSWLCDQPAYHCSNGF